QPLMLLFQRLVASKLGIAPAQPLPASLAWLADREALADSWEKYLAATPQYRAKVKEWGKARKGKTELKKPEPSDVAQEEVEQRVQFGGAGSADSLTVRLALPAAPLKTNGKWDEASRRVVWKADLDARDGGERLPVLCYGTWVEPNDAFQKEHFGK